MNIEYVILIAVLSSLLAYYIGAYYGEKTGNDLGESQAIWNRYRQEFEICHLKWESGYKCNCPTKEAERVCNHYSWDELYSDIKRGYHDLS